MAATPPAYVIQGREVTMPVVVRDAASGTATYLVPAAAARRLLPGPEIDVVEFAPGRALLSLAMIDYRDNDLGDYNEFSIALFVRARRAPRGIPYLGSWIAFLRGHVATYIKHLPVNQAFTCEAGRTIWGFPKSVEDVAITVEGGRATARLAMDGRHVLTFSLPAGGTKKIPEAALETYSYINGVAHTTAFRSTATDCGFSGGGSVALELGGHPIAEELRSLGLPKKPLMAMWMGHMRATFDAPEKL